MKYLSIYLRLGLRNLWLHPARTGLTVLALAVGIAALTFLTAMNDGWMQNIRENFVLTEVGHLQIHAQGFEQSHKISDQIKDISPILDVVADMSGIRAWTGRIRVSGLASAAGSNAGVLVSGVDPEQEKGVSRLPEFVAEGRWFEADERHAVIIGDVLADRLEVGLGDKLVLMAAAPNGDIMSEVFRVRGLIHSGVMDIDNLMALVPLQAARHWLGMDLDGQLGVTDIVIRAHGFEDVNPMQKALETALQGQGLEVLRWMDIDPMAEQWSQFADAYTWIVLAVVILVVLAEVLNTMLMSMHDRIREFGLMEALGTGSGQLFAMMMWETVILVCLGSLLGFVLGGWASAYYGEYGLDLSRFATAFSFMYMSPIVHPLLTFDGCFRILGAAIVGAMIAGLYPAWKVTRLEPAVAMREV